MWDFGLKPFNVNPASEILESYPYFNHWFSWLDIPRPSQVFALEVVMIKYQHLVYDSMNPGLTFLWVCGEFVLTRNGDTREGGTKGRYASGSKTRESADSPPWSCRQVFFIRRVDCLKPSVFYMFHVGKAFWKCHFVLRGPIQNWENCISCRRNDRFFLNHSGKKLEIVLHQEIPRPYSLNASFFNSATSMREVLPRLN